MKKMTSFIMALTLIFLFAIAIVENGMKDDEWEGFVYLMHFDNYTESG